MSFLDLVHEKTQRYRELFFVSSGILWLLGSALLAVGAYFPANGDEKDAARLQEETVFIEPKEQQVTAPQGEMIIDVSGAVLHPGVVVLPLNSRVSDAVSASGGFSENADMPAVAQTLNLAKKIQDGDKIYIPYRNGEVKEAQKSVSVNTATVSELIELPGIGDARAEAIVSGRPYFDIYELVERKILPNSVFAEIQDDITP